MLHDLFQIAIVFFSGLAVHDYVLYYYLAWITLYKLFQSVLKDLRSRSFKVGHLDEALTAVRSVDRVVIA